MRLSKLTKTDFRDQGVCDVCEGKAVIQVTVELPDGTVDVQTRFCESCEGTGLILEDDDVD